MGLKDRIQYFRQHRFVKQAATLQVGNIIGNFIQALIGVFIARILQPELFGVYSIAIGLGSLAAIFIGFGAFNAGATLIGEKYARDDHSGVKEVLGFLVKIIFWSAILALIYILLLPWIGQRFYNNSMVGVYAGIAVLALVVSSTIPSFLTLCLQLVGKIKTMAKLTVIDQLLRYGASLAFVFVGLGVWGAISGQLAGAVVMLVISVTMWAKLKKEYNLFPSLKSLFRLAKGVPLKKYFGFTFWVMLDRNMGTIYLALPVVLTGIYVSTSEVTFFRLAFGYINLAMALLGPISTLLNIEFSKMKADNVHLLARNFKKVSIYSVVLSAVLTAGVIIVSPWAFRILYGDSFLPSIKYVVGLFAYGALYGIGVGLGPMWRAVDKVKVSILINTIILAIGIPTGILLIKQFGIWGAIIMVTLWFTVSHFVSFIYLSRKLKNG